MRRLRIPFLTAVLIALSLILYAGRYDAPPKTQTFVDRNGEVIGTLNSAYQGVQIWTPLKDIPEEVRQKTISAEDRWFYWHKGLNPIALAKAAVSNLIHGHVVRGGSTITQQLAKNLMGSTKRTWFNKVRESLLALGLEMKHSKDWILERYLNSVYYGHRCYGIAAAAQLYFKKDVKDLSAGEADTLVGLPKAPNRPSPGLRPPSPIQYGRGAGGEGQFARHFLEYVSRQLDNETDSHRIQTTLDLNLQKRLEEATARLLADRALTDPQLTAAVVVIDVRTGDLLALVGSRDYFNEEIDGAVNAAVALRQPGSTLKPFTYFAAFTKGFGPDSIVPDEPLSFQAPALGEAEQDGYAPQNFDRRFHGNMTMREALANSYNVPAVVTLNEIGLSYYHDLLKKFGFTSLRKPPTYYGLAVTLGSGEVSLLELTNAYAALARGGAYLPYRATTDRAKTSLAPTTGQPVITNAPRYAAEVTGILTDATARLKSFGFNEAMTVEGHEVAVKTGTSYEHRDNWTVGYTPSYAVGVWVGHADGSPMEAAANGLPTTGASGAGPLWHAAMENLLRGRPEEKFPALWAERSVKPTLEQSEAQPEEIKDLLPRHTTWKVLSPVRNTTFRIHPYLPLAHQKILAEAEIVPTEHSRLSWYLDGRFLETTEGDRQRVWIYPEAGHHDLKIESSDGQSQNIHFRVIDSTAEVGMRE